MSLSLTSRARVLAGSEHRSGIAIGIILLSIRIITKAALKVVCIQLPLSVVGVVDFALIIEGVNRWVARGTDSIRGTKFPFNVLSCEVCAVVSSPSEGPYRTYKLGPGEICDLIQCALVVLDAVQIEGEDAECLLLVYYIQPISGCGPALPSPPPD